MNFKKINLLKNLFLFLVVLLSMNSCHEEDLDSVVTTTTEQINVDNYNIYSTSYKHLKGDNAILDQKLKSINKGNVIDLQLRTDSELYNFSFEEEQVQVIETNNYTSYTFLVLRDDQTPFMIENYMLIQYDDGNYNQYLISYNYTYSADGEKLFSDENTVITEIFDDSLIQSRITCVPELVDSFETTICTNMICTGGANHDINEYSDCDCVWNTTLNCNPPSIDCGENTIFIYEENCSGSDVNPNNPNNTTNPGGSTTGNTFIAVPNKTETINVQEELIDDLQLERLIDQPLINWINDVNNTVETTLLYNYVNDNRLEDGSVSQEAIDFSIKFIGISDQVSDLSVLSTVFEHKSFTRVIGNILTASLSKVFTEHSEAFNEVADIDTLSLTDWQMISEKALELYEILPAYPNGIVIGQNDLSIEHQNLVTFNSTIIVFLPHIKSLTFNHWPTTAEQWSAIATILGQFLIELGLAVIPGSSIIDVTNGLEEGDYWAVTIGIAGLVVDAFGGTIIKIIGKVGKVAWKTFKIFKLVFNHLNGIVNTIELGFKTVLDGDLVKIVDNAGNTIGDIVSTVLRLKYTGFGGDIITQPDKTTTLIGKWANQLENIWNTGLAKQGENVGGINILGDISGSLQQQWNINKQWLMDAMSRGDAIRVTADPSNVSNVIYNNVDNINFNNFNEVVNYMTSFDELSPQFANLSFFGKEIHTLLNNGYSFNLLTNTFQL